MVHCELLPVANGFQIGVLRLDSPARLNAQTLAMVHALDAALGAWRERDDVVAVLVLGEGERGLCAGGDLKALYEAMGAAETLADGDAFFAEEYALCRDLHFYPKPVVAWGHGVVMGGGWGLFAGAHHRVVTESTRLAMPEIAIGLFPDVGASRWLHQLPGHLGRWLALTASELNATDALWAGAAHAALPDEARAALRPWLAALPWSGVPLADATMLRTALLAWAAATPCRLPAPRWAPLAERIDALCGGATLAEVADGLRAHADDPALADAVARFQVGSPTSAWLIWALEQRARQVAFHEVFALETQVAWHVLRSGEFREGIRARLIDRHDTPHWHARDFYGNLPDEIAAWLSRDMRTA
ncbi:enoyl-CoA hydratase/isomerase family protein [Chitiniphilus eburneus]|uniref:3-hydroxyisobutyryl-CoA hydrolase n=1 Tax=Chitiniphilus eburneus TaxID=2571148 RepID=A0A4U0Q4M8_9NEIS|nr:enoyl-CoA hydratase/isomerase family protein [Chitiniphilus eburneus]TJZ75670.1 enoyl-CoA hydratase/isomerase family protein [Chitiniphilus eburneus]